MSAASGTPTSPTASGRRAAVIHAKDVPVPGGDTMFVNQYLA
jgi:hypothetical protein